MIISHEIKNIVFLGNTMKINVDNKVYIIELATVSEKLLLANDLQRQFYKLSPSGYGIHWPLIDEDLSVDFLTKAARSE